MERRVVLRREVSSAETVLILCWSESNYGYASDIWKYPRWFPEVAIVSELRQGNRYQSWWRDILYYPKPRGLTKVCGEWIMCQTSTDAGQYTRKCTEPQSGPLHKGFRIQSIILWSISFVQQWWSIPNAWQCGWNDTQTKRSYSMLIDSQQAPFAFTTWSINELGANYAKSQWLPLRATGD